MWVARSPQSRGSLLSWLEVHWLDLARISAALDCLEFA